MLNIDPQTASIVNAIQLLGIIILGCLGCILIISLIF